MMLFGIFSLGILVVSFPSLSYKYTVIDFRIPLDPLRNPQPLLQLYWRLRRPLLSELVRRRNLHCRHCRQRPPPLAPYQPRRGPRLLQIQLCGYRRLFL